MQSLKQYKIGQNSNARFWKSHRMKSCVVGWPSFGGGSDKLQKFRLSVQALRELIGMREIWKKMCNCCTTPVAAIHGSAHVAEEVAVWIDRIRIFGFHLARLDVRQDSRQYATVVNEIMGLSGICKNAAELDDQARQDLLIKTLDESLEFSAAEMSEESQETWSLFQLINNISTMFGPQALGANVISMTHSASDIISRALVVETRNYTSR